MKFFAFALVVLVAIAGASAEAPIGEELLQQALASLTGALDSLASNVDSISETVTGAVTNNVNRITAAATDLQVALSSAVKNIVQARVICGPLMLIVNTVIDLVTTLLDTVISTLANLLPGSLKLLVIPIFELRMQIVHALNEVDIALESSLACVRAAVGPILDAIQTCSDALTNTVDDFVAELNMHLDAIVSIVVDEIHNVTAVIASWKSYKDIVAGVPPLLVHVGTLLVTLPRTTAELTALLTHEVGVLTDGLNGVLVILQPAQEIAGKLVSCLESALI